MALLLLLHIPFGSPSLKNRGGTRHVIALRERERERERERAGFRREDSSQLVKSQVYIQHLILHQVHE